MQILAGLLWFAVVGGLLAALGLIVRRSRRRTKRIAEQLGGEIVPTTSRLVIAANRKQHAASAVLLGILCAYGVAAIVDGRVAVGVLVSLVSVPLFAFAARKAAQRTPELAVDGDGITAGTGDVIHWGDIELVRLCERATSYGVHRHELVLELRHALASDSRKHAITLRLEMLSMSWNDVAAAVQARYGRRIVTD